MRYDFKKLKEARERKLLTQTQFAKLTGLSISTINQVELGKAPWIKAIRTMALFLELQPSEIVNNGAPKKNGARKVS